MPINIIIAGAPGSGKGTQCAELVKRYGSVHVSTGDILRAEVEAGTDLGKQADGIMKAGGLVPDDVMIPIVQRRLAQPDCQKQGWILDGFPRTGNQAKALSKNNIIPDVFINLAVPQEILMERIIHRRLDPVTNEIYHLKFKPPPPEVLSRLTHRKDDMEDKVMPRLESFNRAISAILGEYAALEVRIDANRPIRTVLTAVTAAIDGASIRQGIAAADPQAGEVAGAGKCPAIVSAAGAVTAAFFLAPLVAAALRRVAA
eukprot:TRINITY_DN269_c0_g1_i1.p1 TRINITY_DN269_c0_g1~~TRINITY_DN269_c0_g1_i1.p1  ORF type:complete len:293 (-),score=52.20 TRINITY_DN269_c0_g1_i1:320-1096(-)